MPKIILDATVLLNFARADALDDLLEGRPHDLAVGLLVEQEVRVWPRQSTRAGRPFSLREFIERGLLERVEMTSEELSLFHAAKTRIRLGDGETEAAVIATSRGWGVATDDGAARRKLAAHIPPIPVTGSIGLLRALVQAKVVSRKEAARLLDLMRERGARLPAATL